MQLSLVLHGHQPPGNFDHVFRLAVDTCYGPVLDLIEERPATRVSMHWSGSLLEWLAEHTPERIAQIRRLVERDQIELVTAGLYEPVLVLLSRADRLGQLRAHQAYLEELFGRWSNVGWLTERVWEQEIAADLVEGGIRTVTLDDQHLMAGGADPAHLDAPYITESQGQVLRVVPVSGPLRMAIPWRPVPDVIDLIRAHADRGDRMLVYADDIEKFGLWPGTFEDVIQSGWLAQFFDAVEQLDGVDLVPLGEAVEATPVAGRTYMPDGSYPEMLEWSLPPEAHRRLVKARGAIAEGDPAGLTPFLRAGTYRQFLAKYPEVNHLHKRMLDVSRRLHAAIDASTRAEPDARLQAARRSLWRAQANCVYWHGLFGGCYLPVLRHTAWESLLTAERLLARTRAGRAHSLRIADLDADGHEEIALSTPELVIVAAPAEGAVIEVSHLPSALNLANTLARRPEAYHPADAPPSAYDHGRRGWFVDRVAAASKRPPRADRIEDLGAFAGEPYEPSEVTRNGFVLTRTSDIAGRAVRVEKRIHIESPEGIEAQYDVRVTDDRTSRSRRQEVRFAVSIDLGLLHHADPAGELRIDGDTHALPRGGSASAARRIALRIDGVAVAVTIELEPAADIDVRPVATESRSEAGVERILQSLAVSMSWPLRLDHTTAALTPRIRVSIEHEDSGAGRGTA